MSDKSNYHNYFTGQLANTNLAARRPNGFSLIEVLIGSTIITISLISMIIAFQSVVELERRNTRITQASFLAEEALEASRVLRTDNWNNLSSLTTGVDYFLSYNAGAWGLSTGLVLIDGLFDRRLRLSPVNRDVNHRITSSGSLDPGTIKVSTSVAWREGSATTTRSIETYLTNIFSN